MSPEVRCIACEEAEIAQLVRRIKAAAAELENLQAQVDEVMKQITALANCKEEGASQLFEPLVDLDTFHMENSALLEQKKLEIGKLEQELSRLQKLKP